MKFHFCFVYVFNLGKDNYLGEIYDDTFKLSKWYVDRNQKMNTAFYNRWYKVKEEGAMGTKTNHYGFADRNLYVAETTQPNVAGLGLDVSLIDYQ